MIQGWLPFINTKILKTNKQLKPQFHTNRPLIHYRTRYFSINEEIKDIFNHFEEKVANTKNRRNIWAKQCRLKQNKEHNGVSAGKA